MPEPTASELAREAEQEAAVFAQAVHVEKLLYLLRAFDPAKDNLADNEEIQVCNPMSFTEVRVLKAITGIISVEHGAQATYCQAD